ncbi:PREDICTED: battenin [Thamnophis sirtalis]|uniref:Battenin n=1 Tax=Thamnophis sirtalis TaxID=35019 RepID=A0A6I9Z3I7_9SAUR|nr:PREDICTED: battenin [Thamnophis sirtalis]
MEHAGGRWQEASGDSEEENESMVHSSESEATLDACSQRRNNAGFWLLGLCNNFAYVVMLSAAHDILSHQKVPDHNGTAPIPPSASPENTTTNTSGYDCNTISTGAVLLADILPTLFIKFSAPFCIHLFPYGLRVAICVTSAWGSFLLVAFSTSITQSLLGVVLASISSGLGEITFLALTSFFNSAVVSAWSSGTGGAGLIGALSYLGLTQIGLSPQDTLLFMTIVPVIMLASYCFLLAPPPQAPRCGWGVCKPKSPRAPSVIQQPLLGDRLTHPQMIQKPQLTLQEKEQVAKVRSLLRESGKDLLSCASVNRWFLAAPIQCKNAACQDTLSSAVIFELLYFRNTTLNHPQQYRWYQMLYQAGVFISRSSASCIRIRKIWVLAILQCLNMVFLLFAVSYLFLPSIFLVFVLILYEGLLGGAGYVNTFHCVSEESKPEHREFAMGVACIADTLGISLSGAIAIPVHNYFCHLP